MSEVKAVYIDELPDVGMVKRITEMLDSAEVPRKDRTVWFLEGQEAMILRPVKSIIAMAVAQANEVHYGKAKATY